jgi:hypothetical protein
MSTITDFRSMSRSLYGTDPTTDRGFVDAVLDRTINQAVSEFSQHVPIKATATVNVTGGSRTWGMAAALTRPIRVMAVEYPVDRWPRVLLDFDVWGDTVTLDHSPPAGGYSVKVYYDQAHLVDASGSTIEAEHEYLVAEGAFVYSLFARTIGAANTFDTTATGTPMPNAMQHLRVAEARLAHWRRQLRRVASQVQTRSLYPPGSRPYARDVVQPL